VIQPALEEGALLAFPRRSRCEALPFEEQVPRLVLPEDPQSPLQAFRKTPEDVGSGVAESDP
jgi:hypothetical protein